MGVQGIKTVPAYLIGVEWAAGQGDYGSDPNASQTVNLCLSLQPAAGRQFRFDEPTEVPRECDFIGQSSRSPSSRFLG